MQCERNQMQKKKNALWIYKQYSYDYKEQGHTVHLKGRFASVCLINFISMQSVWKKLMDSKYEPIVLGNNINIFSKFDAMQSHTEGHEFCILYMIFLWQKPCFRRDEKNLHLFILVPVKNLCQQWTERDHQSGQSLVVSFFAENYSLKYRYNCCQIHMKALRNRYPPNMDAFEHLGTPRTVVRIRESTLLCLLVSDWLTGNCKSDIKKK